MEWIVSSKWARAVVVGTDGRDLHFSSIRLNDSPAIADSYTRKGASQGELRSHGFFTNLTVRIPEHSAYR